MSYGSPPPYPPNQPVGPGGPYGYGPPPEQRQATTALVLGILGVALCQLIAPFAWAIGRSSLREIDASGGALGGRGKAQAGYIMGLVGSILLIIVVVGFALLLVGGLATSSPSFDHGGSHGLG